jgi:3-hydroxyisobutyrate dehydrogenase-like beta-hydroxyacid dehydrogenase
MKAAFLGLGNMGSSMASRIAEAGLPLTVWNRDAQKAIPLARLGAKVASSLQEALTGADLVFTMLADDLALMSVIDLKSLSLMSPEGIHISMSTVSLSAIESLERLSSSIGRGHLSCPVFGRPLAASQGNLKLCLAGQACLKERVRPYLAPMGQCFDFGDRPSDANVVKLAGNFMIASTMEMLGEALALVEKHGLSPRGFFDFISQNMFASPIVKTYGQLLIDQDFLPAGFPASLAFKDVELVHQAAKEAKTPMPMASVLQLRLLKMLAQGQGQKDWSAMGQSQREDAGLE